MWSTYHHSRRSSFVVLFYIAFCLLCGVWGTENVKEKECDNPEKETIRLVTKEELATKTGVDGSDIWLSIMGEIYDVTEGQEYYAPGKGYSAFAGKDASVPFCTGNFTDEEANKSTEVLTLNELPGLESWRDFYRKHEVYKFVGYLIDPRFYDENGNPTSEKETLEGRINTAKVAEELKKRQRKEKLKEKRINEEKEKARRTTLQT